MTTKMQQDQDRDSQTILLGNEAISRGALEAGLNFAAGYPGTPSTEIIENLAKDAKKMNLHVEWSTNEKVAAEGAAAAAIAGLRSLASMKSAGLSVALDFLTHLSMSGLGDGQGAMLVVVCDDPDGHSSGDETDSRWLAKFSYAPLMEPSSVQEAYRMIGEAFRVSEKFRCYVMFRSYTRLSHGSSMVKLDELHRTERTAHVNPKMCLHPYLAKPKHDAVLKQLSAIEVEFENSPFNEYFGPKNPELVVVASGGGVLCAREAIEILGLGQSVGLLKLATLWPFPRKVVQRFLRDVPKVLVVEEVDPFVEFHVKEALYDVHTAKQEVYGKLTGHVPAYGEIDPDRVLTALSRIAGVTYTAREEPYNLVAQEATEKLLGSRGLPWCAGCPHRATFWSLEKALKGDKRGVCVTGDIGCYTLDVFPGGKGQTTVLHAMGSGVGVAAGLGQMHKFGAGQPVISICGDSTFFHASLPGLISAVYNKSNFIQIVLDNETTAMTGTQAHPGVGYNLLGEEAPLIDIGAVCRAIGTPVTTVDPFDIKGTTAAIRNLLKMDGGVRVLIVKRMCELHRMRREKAKPFKIKVDQEICRGAKCRICYAYFRCPAFSVEEATGKALIRQDACCGCGACVSVCPSKAIAKEKSLS
jgi:indolepyruvate ferredoxin oxidoreductase alpha subunit